MTLTRFFCAQVLNSVFMQKGLELIEDFGEKGVGDRVGPPCMFGLLFVLMFLWSENRQQILRAMTLEHFESASRQEDRHGMKVYVVVIKTPSKVKNAAAVLNLGYFIVPEKVFILLNVYKRLVRPMRLAYFRCVVAYDFIQFLLVSLINEC